MTHTNWSNLTRDGIRLERVIASMLTRMNNEPSSTMYLAFLDRFLKAYHQKMLLVDRVLGVKTVLKEANKSEIMYE